MTTNTGLGLEGECESYLGDEQQLSVLAAAEQGAQGLHGPQVEVGQLHGVDLTLGGGARRGRRLVATCAVLMAPLPVALCRRRRGREHSVCTSAASPSPSLPCLLLLLLLLRVQGVRGDLALGFRVRGGVRFDLVQAVRHAEVGSSGRGRRGGILLLRFTVPLRLAGHLVGGVFAGGGGRVVSAGAAVLLVVAPGAQLGGVLVDAGQVGEVQQEGGGQAAEARHVKGEGLAGLQVVQRRVTRRPKSWEAFNQDQSEKETQEKTQSEGKGQEERKRDRA